MRMLEKRHKGCFSEELSPRGAVGRRLERLDGRGEHHPAVHYRLDRRLEHLHRAVQSAPASGRVGGPHGRGAGTPWAMSGGRCVAQDRYLAIIART